MRKQFKFQKKRYVVNRRKTKLSQRVRKHPTFFVPLITFGVLSFTVGLALIIFHQGNPVPQLTASNSRIVIINVDKEERVIPTRSDTVGDLLKKLDIKINDGDVVEPALDTEIVSDNFRVNVYRAMPITVYDGGREIRTLSAAATPRSIAKQAGIEAYPEDILDLDPVDNFVKQGIVGQRLVVQRATPININLYGTQLAVRTHAKTVGEFLKEKKISLAGGETVQPSIDSELRTDQPVFVNRKGIQVETVTENIASSVQIVEDDKLSFGVKAVRQQGAPGKRVVTYQVNLLTGERKPFQQIVIQEPVPQIVARGTYINIPANKQAVMAAAGISKSDYSYVDFIISHESRWNAAALNASGCAGLGQACPGSKLARVCPNWQSDAVCQLKFFSGYASRYGGWKGSYAAWQSKGWW